MTMEEVAEDYLIELIKRNLIQVVEATTDGRVNRCRIHDLLRDIMVSKSKDENYFAVAKEHGMIWPEKIRRLSIINYAAPSIGRRLSANRLRSLLMFWRADSVSLSPAFKLPFGLFRLLNVLDLGGAPLKEFPKEVPGLILLKYLSLRNTEVACLPSSIGKLLNLETLDLKHARVTELPVEILKLVNLRHLLVYRYGFVSDDQINDKHGVKAPAKIGDLQSLQKLCFLEAHKGSCLMTELGRLNQLRRLGIVNLRKEDGQDLCSSIEKLINLRALSITSMEQTEIIDLEHLSSPPQFLQRLYLTGRLEKLPAWISSLDSLVKVVLRWSRLSDDPLPSLQHLPNLVHLEFVQVYDGELLIFQAEGFQRLKFLGLKYLDRLKIITVEQGAMPCLEKLVVKSCKSLLGVTSGIEHLSELKVIELFDVPTDFIKGLLPYGQGGDYEKSKASNRSKRGKPATSFAEAFDQLFKDHIYVRIMCFVLPVAVMVFFLHLVECLIRIQPYFGNQSIFKTHSHNSSVVLSKMTDYPLLSLALCLMFLLCGSCIWNPFTRSIIRQGFPLVNKKVRNMPEIYCTMSDKR